MEFEYQDLTSLIDKDKSNCLNQAEGFSFEMAQSGSEALLLRSDADEQLLINVYLSSPIKLHHIILNPGESLNNAPSKIKIFVNRCPMDFDDAEKEEPTEELELTEEESAGDSIVLDYVKFQDVKNFVLFIEKNLDDEEFTEMGALELYGEAREVVDMSKFQSANQERIKRKEERENRRKHNPGRAMRNCNRKKG